MDRFVGGCVDGLISYIYSEMDRDGCMYRLVGVCMYGWIDGRVNEWMYMYTWVDVCMGGWINGSLGGCMGGRMYGWKEQWMCGWMDG